MFTHTNSFRIIKTPSQSKSFSRTRQKTSPSPNPLNTTHSTHNIQKQAHLQLTQTTSRLKQPLPQLRPKFVSQTLPAISSPNRINLQFLIEQLRAQIKQLKQQNNLFESQLSAIRTMSQCNQGEKQDVLIKRLLDEEERYRKELRRLEKEVQGKDKIINVLKESNLRLLKEGRVEAKGEIYDQLQSYLKLLNKEHDLKSNQQSKTTQAYFEILNNKNIQIIKLSDTVNSLTTLLTQINQLVQNQHNEEFSLLPEKLRYLLKYKLSEKNKQIQTLENQNLTLSDEVKKREKQIEGLKKQFTEKVKQISGDLNGIIENMKKQFDALKVENWILTTENKELSQIKKQMVQGKSYYGKNKWKGKSKEQQKQIDNNITEQANLTQPKLTDKQLFQSNKSNHKNPITTIVSPSNQAQNNNNSILFKTSTLKSFSHWIYQWSHSSFDQDRLILLQLLISNKQLLQEGVSKSLSHLSSLLYASLVTTKSEELQLVTIEIICLTIQNRILEEHNLYIDKIILTILSLVEKSPENVLMILYFYIKRKDKLDKEVKQSIIQCKVMKKLNQCFGKNQFVEETLFIFKTLSADKEFIQEFVQQKIDEQLLTKLQDEQQHTKEILEILHNLLSQQQYIQQVSNSNSESDILNKYKIFLKLVHTKHNAVSFKTLKILLKIPSFLKSLDRLPLVSEIITNLNKFPSSSQQLLQILLKQTTSEQFQPFLVVLEPIISSIQNILYLDILLKILLKSKKNDTKAFDQKCIEKILTMLREYENIQEENRNILSKVIRIIIERNKQVVNKALQANNYEYLASLYLQHKTNNFILISFLQLLIELKKPQFQPYKIKLIPKLIQDSTNNQPKIRTISLRNLIQFSKQQDFHKLFKPQTTIKIFSHLSQLKDQQSISLTLSLIYFLSSSPQHSQSLLPTFMKTIMKIFLLFPSSKSIILKSLTLIQKIHLNNYDKYITNQIVEESELNVLSIMNKFALGNENKKEVIDHCLFLYKSLNNPIPIQILAKNISKSKDSKKRIVEDMVEMSREYINVAGNGKLGNVVKQMLIEMGRFNKKIKEEVDQLEKKREIEK